MTWLLYALLAYVFGAITVFLDKYLLGTGRIPSAPVYAFYVGLFSLAALVLAPLGIEVPATYELLLSLISGIFFVLSLLYLYKAIRTDEASRVTPIYFASATLFTYVLMFLLDIERLTSLQGMGVGLLIVGGLLISWKFSSDSGRGGMIRSLPAACLAGLLLAPSYLALKMVYVHLPFLSGFVWSRFGAFVGACLLLLVPVWRRQIVRTLRGAKRPRKKHLQTGLLFVINKLVGGFSALLFNLAFSKGIATVINSLVSLQYVFVFGLVVWGERLYPTVFKEQLTLRDGLQKMIAVMMIAAGVALISVSIL